MSWFVPLRGQAGAASALYAFPHAGATAATLGPFAQAGAGRFQMYCVDLPGRLQRLAEPVWTDFPSLVTELAGALATEVARHAGRSYLLLGVCGGAYLALETARALRAAQTHPPAAVAVVSAPAPDVARPPYRVADLPSEALWEQLTRDDGVPGELAANRSFRRLAEPAVRADFALFADYRYCPLPPLDTPITALYGTEDTGLRPGAVLGWQRQSREPLRIVGVPGAGRWPLEERPDEVCQALTTCVSG